MIIRRIRWMAFVIGGVTVVTTAAILSLTEIGPLPLILIAPLILMLMKQQHSSGKLGTARLATMVDLILAGILSERSGPIIGCIGRIAKPPLSVRLEALFCLPWSMSRQAMAICRPNTHASSVLRLPESIAVHTAYIAPTGVAKTTAGVIPQLLTDPANSLVLDFSGEILCETAYARMQQFGHEVVCIAPFGLPSGMDFPISRFNPLQLINADGRLFFDQARALGSSLVVRSANEHQPYFNDTSEIIIQNLLAVLLSEAGAEDCTLGELRRIVSLPDKLKSVTSLMLNHPSRHKALLKELGGQLQTMQENREFGAILSTVNTHLRWIDSTPMKASLSGTDFKPGHLLGATTPMTIYYHIPVDLLASYQGYTRVFFTSIANLIFRAGKSTDRRIRFYLDESHGLGSKLDALYSALIYGRKYGIRLHFYLQAISQIEEIFEGSRSKQFLGNVMPIFTGIRDLETAKEVSATIGRMTVQAQTTQSGGNVGRSEGFNDKAGYTVNQSRGYSWSRSEQETVRELLQPEEILRLPKGTTIIPIPYMPPVIAKPYFYFENKRLAKLAEQSRNYVLGGQAEPSWLHRILSRGRSPWSAKRHPND